MEIEEEIARAIPPVVDTAADIYQGGQRAWHDVETVGQIAHDTAESGIREAERAAARPVSWAVDRGARAVGAAREAFDWISD